MNTKHVATFLPILFCFCFFQTSLHAMRKKIDPYAQPKKIDPYAKHENPSSVSAPKPKPTSSSSAQQKPGKINPYSKTPRRASGEMLPLNTGEKTGDNSAAIQQLADGLTKLNSDYQEFVTAATNAYNAGSFKDNATAEKTLKDQLQIK